MHLPSPRRPCAVVPAPFSIVAVAFCLLGGAGTTPTHTAYDELCECVLASCPKRVQDSLGASQRPPMSHLVVTSHTDSNITSLLGTCMTVFVRLLDACGRCIITEHL